MGAASSIVGVNPAEAGVIDEGKNILNFVAEKVRYHTHQYCEEFMPFVFTIIRMLEYFKVHLLGWVQMKNSWFLSYALEPKNSWRT